MSVGTLDREVRSQASTGQMEPATAAAASALEPKWTVDVGSGCEVGLTIDDGCFVVLYPQGGGWKPGSYIPKAAAKKIAALLDEGALR